MASDNGVVEILLKHATNDELSKDVKQNAAICLAKLATSDKRYKRAIVFLVLYITKYSVILNVTGCKCLKNILIVFFRHLEKLKEMHGLEILHSVIQNTNLS